MTASTPDGTAAPISASQDGDALARRLAARGARVEAAGLDALLAGIDPKAVHEWYLAVYVDAYEWVELPNTLGMSQYADGGLLGTKPYALT